MPEIDNPKALFESACSTNSEPYALQNIGDMMTPEFSENCIIIVDPGMPIHHQAYAIIDYKDELYFRQYIEQNNSQFIRSLNSSHPEIELIDDVILLGNREEKQVGGGDDPQYFAFLEHRQVADSAFAHDVHAFFNAGFRPHMGDLVAHDFRDLGGF